MQLFGKRINTHDIKLGASAAGEIACQFRCVSLRRINRRNTRVYGILDGDIGEHDCTEKNFLKGM